MRRRTRSGIGLLAVGLALATALAGAESRATAATGSRTVPFFTGSFTSGGTTYPYTMVGTDPAETPATTTVPTVIVPLRLAFSDGSVSDPGSSAAAVAGSPLFQAASFSSGTTQYGDAIRRAMFWSEVGGTDYHVLLGAPTIMTTQTLQVPAGQGVMVPPGGAIGPPSFGFHAQAERMSRPAWIFDPDGPRSVSGYAASFLPVERRGVVAAT